MAKKAERFEVRTISEYGSSLIKMKGFDKFL